MRKAGLENLTLTGQREISSNLTELIEWEQSKLVKYQTQLRDKRERNLWRAVIVYILKEHGI